MTIDCNNIAKTYRCPKLDVLHKNAITNPTKINIFSYFFEEIYNKKGANKTKELNSPSTAPLMI